MSVSILIGDCRERMKELADASVDSVVCDPPYHLTSIVKRFGAADAAPAKVGKTGAYARASKGFMGQTWDGGDVAFQPETWAEVLRVLKPGGHLVAFSGTRTYHRMAVAIEDAGFEIRDQLAWVYGSGFPKSLDVSKAIDKRRDDSSDIEHVRIWLEERRLASGMTRKAVNQALGLADNGGGLMSSWTTNRTTACVPQWEQWLQLKSLLGFGDEMDAEVWRLNGRKGQPGEAWQTAEVIGVKEGAMSGWSMDGKTKFVDREVKAANSEAAQQWHGWGTALKPSWEPICLARKPLDGTVAGNVLKHGTGAINIDGCRIGFAGDADAASAVPGGRATGKPLSRLAGSEDARAAFTPSDNSQDRWPANIIHDGSDEVLAGFPRADGGHWPDATRTGGGDVGGGTSDYRGPGPKDEQGGSAARFFYAAKASTEERGEGNNHPTVKPQALMRWLVRLITPPGGTVLDPFMGSGSTLIAADAEQFNAIGCEMSPEYAAIAERRIRNAAGMFADVKVAA